MKLIFSATTAVLVAGAVCGSAVVNERNTRRLLQQEMEARLVLEARNLALLSADALLAQFPELTLCPLLREMGARQPNMTLAVVLDHAGRVQGHQDARVLGQPFTILDSFKPEPSQIELRTGEQILGNDGTVAVRAPVRHANGQALGSVIVGQDRGRLSAVLAATRRQELLLALFLALGGGLIAVVLMRRLLHPVDALRRGLERIGRGDLNTPIDLSDRTELGLLATTVNAMAVQLGSSRSESQAKEREIVETQRELILTLGVVVEGRSHETANHTIRVGQAAALLGELAGLSRDEVELLRMAAPMHDVGKIGIPDAVLNKPGKFTREDFEIMKTHPELGRRILDHSERPLLKAAAIIAHQHHERWDGDGYPRRLRAEQIHIYGRLVSIADVFDALTCNRVYRKGMTLAEAMQIMEAGRGTQFDPRLLDLFMANIGTFRTLVEKYADTFEAPQLEPVEQV